MTTQLNKKALNGLFYSLLMIVLLFMASSIGFLFRMIGFPETNIVIVYLLAVLLTASRTKGYIYGILASVIATFAFNYFFTEPYYTFAVSDPSYIVTFIIMTITALITSTLTSHVKKSAVEAQEKEAETKALYMLTNHLTDAAEIHNIAGIAASIISTVMNCKAACLCFDENGLPEKTFVQQISPEKQIRRNVANTEDIKHQIEGLRTGYSIGTEFYDWLIYGRDNILGIIRIPTDKAIIMTEAQTRLLRAMIESIALAMDRFRSAEQRIKYREETVQERYRGNLLRAISHDLRTPLSGIMGTSEMLMDMSKQNDPRYKLAEEIHNDANWLHSLVENILSLTRLQEGRLTLNKQLEAVEEIVGGAVHHIIQRSPQHEIIIDIPDELLLVPMDAKLIEQVLINLLDNAIKHTPSGNEISIFVIKDDKTHCAVFTVADRGEGIAETDLPNIFQMFYTSHTKHADAQHGIGLGLAICDAIVKAHGGNIEAHNHSDGQGAKFIFTLPMEVTENE
ncbi:MAG: histidine kinase [Clostridiales bacterium GWF2_38_85]|nr:MAG: histidine kinase [Clostridiales bacterium GWF2_38_85]